MFYRPDPVRERSAVCVQTVLPSPETIAANICNDGLDNDCDGLIDCADTDCANDPACRVAGEGDVSLKKLVGPKQIICKSPPKNSKGEKDK